MRRLLLASAALTASVGASLTGCSTYSEPSPPTGVDELEIPTPSPDPAGFTAEIDNPWFLLDDAAYAGPLGSLVERTVGAGPEVDGVSTTAVTIGTATDYYAQDDGGNVWWFGREGQWEAGTDDALAGLAMPAEPRVGDGFRRAEVPGQDLRAEVAEIDDASVVLETYDDTVVTLVRYTRGLGLEVVENEAGDVLLVRQEEGE